MHAAGRNWLRLAGAQLLSPSFQVVLESVERVLFGLGSSVGRESFMESSDFPSARKSLLNLSSDRTVESGSAGAMAVCRSRSALWVLNRFCAAFSAATKSETLLIPGVMRPVGLQQQSHDAIEILALVRLERLSLREQQGTPRRPPGSGYSCPGSTWSSKRSDAARLIQEPQFRGFSVGFLPKANPAPGRTSRASSALTSRTSQPTRRSTQRDRR